jgi:hypothetical protein
LTLAIPGIRTGPTGKPDLTLGWEVLQWTADYLLQPDGPEAGEPWRFTPEQARFVLFWYAVSPQGRFVYRSGMFRRMKGHGKDPLAAALCCVEFVGPCRFGGFQRGELFAEPHSAAWVQVAAVSKDQTRNTMTLFPGMLSRKAIQEYRIDLGKEIIYAHEGRNRIEAVTSSPRALEGGRATFVIKNESHHWIESNEGLQMSSVIARNAAKSRDGSSRVLAISNAHAPGEGSDAELDYEAFRLGSPDFLYDSLEASEDVRLDDTDALKEALLWCRGDSHWLDVDRLIAEIQDPRTGASTARRFYLNQLAASEDRAFDRERWEQQKREGYKVAAHAQIVAGFDGSVSNDHTALIATEIATGHQWVAGYWEPRLIDGEFRIPIGEVNATVNDLFERYDVWRLNCDPYYWREQIDAWAGRWNNQDHKPVVSWDTTRLKQTAVALLTYHNAIMAREVTHDGDPRFTACIQNAYRQEQYFVDDNGEKMWTIRKERQDSPLKIDAAMAGMLSWEARSAAVAAGVLDHKTVGFTWV